MRFVFASRRVSAPGETAAAPSQPIRFKSAFLRSDSEQRLYLHSRPCLECKRSLMERMQSSPSLLGLGFLMLSLSRATSGSRGAGGSASGGPRWHQGDPEEWPILPRAYRREKVRHGKRWLPVAASSCPSTTAPGASSNPRIARRPPGLIASFAHRKFAGQTRDSDPGALHQQHRSARAAGQRYGPLGAC